MSLDPLAKPVRSRRLPRLLLSEPSPISPRRAVRSCGDVDRSIFPPSRGQRALGSSASTLHRRGQAVARQGQKASFPAGIGVEFPISLVNPHLAIDKD
jgi:hypothetical protein